MKENSQTEDDPWHTDDGIHQSKHAPFAGEPCEQCDWRHVRGPRDRHVYPHSVLFWDVFHDEHIQNPLTHLMNGTSSFVPHFVGHFCCF